MRSLDADFRPGQMHAKPLAPVLPALLEFEAAFPQNRLDHLARVLVAIFGVDALAFGKANVHVEHGNKHLLRNRAFQMHLHSRATAIPQRDVAEGIGIEVGTEFPVYPDEDVLVERCGHALRVIVGRYQNLWALRKISSQQHASPARSVRRMRRRMRTDWSGSKLPMLEPMYRTSLRPEMRFSASTPPV